MVAVTMDHLVSIVSTVSLWSEVVGLSMAAGTACKAGEEKELSMVNLAEKDTMTPKERLARLIAGKPIGEPVARYGPFVMNSREEVLQAVESYRSGAMGIL